MSTTELDHRWVVRHGVRYWEGGEFPEPTDAELRYSTYISKRKLGAADELACGHKRGTHAGSRIHYRAGQRPCEPCRAASAKFERDRLYRINNPCAGCGKPVTRKATRCTSCSQIARRTKEKVA